MNDTGTLILTEFLLARVAEDEAEIRVFSDPTWSPIVRRLAECEAKRRIADLHKNEGVHSPSCLTCAGEVDPDGHTEWMHWPCDTILLLALPYADHPEYREEWKP